MNRLIVSIHKLSLSTVLGLQYSDGGVEFRDRNSLEVLPRDDYLSQVSSLSQVGFEFPDVGLCKCSRTFQQIMIGGLEKKSDSSNYYLGFSSAFSPNACAIAFLGENHEVKLGMMQISVGGFDESADRGVLKIFTKQGRGLSLTLQQHW